MGRMDRVRDLDQESNAMQCNDDTIMLYSILFILILEYVTFRMNVL